MGAGGFYPERNTERGNGATALHAAVENGHESMVSLLLSWRVAARSMEGAPLLLSLQYRHPNIAHILINATPPPGWTRSLWWRSALFVAAGEGFGDVVGGGGGRRGGGVVAGVAAGAAGAAGAAAGRGHSFESDFGRRNRRPSRAHGATALSNACHRGRLGAMRTLLVAGADPSWPSLGRHCAARAAEGANGCGGTRRSC